MSLKSERKILKGLRKVPTIFKQELLSSGVIARRRKNAIYSVDDIFEKSDNINDGERKTVKCLNVSSSIIDPHDILSAFDRTKRKCKKTRTVCRNKISLTKNNNGNKPVSNEVSSPNSHASTSRYTMLTIGENHSLPITKLNKMNKPKCMCYIVDTNILLDYQDLLDDIGGKVCDNYQVTIIIPYAALNELNGLKKSKNISPDKVQSAIRWCNKHIEAKTHWIICQTYEQYEAASQLCEANDADGHIRNCALLYKKAKNHVTLITNDINLKNLAILCGLKAYNVHQLHQALGDALFVVGNLMVDMDIAATPPKRYSIVPPDNQVNNVTISNYLCNIRKSIADTLGQILRYVMISTYDNLWEQIVLIKPPWTSSTVIKCFLKHWIAIFTDKLSKDVHNTLQDISVYLKGMPALPTLRQVQSLANKVVLLYELLEGTDYTRFIERFEVIPDLTEEPQIGQCNTIDQLFNDIGKYSHAIFLLNRRHLQDLHKSNFPNEKEISVINSLTNLQSSLVSLGYAIMRFSETPTLACYSDIQFQTRNFWISAESCDRKVGSVSYDEYNKYFSTTEGKEFQQRYMNELEAMINKIRQILLEHDNLSKGLMDAVKSS